jgi:hypothetical protein
MFSGLSKKSSDFMDDGLRDDYSKANKEDPFSTVYLCEELGDLSEFAGLAT